MPLAEIYERLTQILRDVFDDQALVAGPELTADQVDGWDSFSHLRVIFAVEKTFGMRFAASQIAGLQNVGDLARLIHAKVS
jgi:acyl carrier protein